MAWLDPLSELVKVIVPEVVIVPLPLNPVFPWTVTEVTVPVLPVAPISLSIWDLVLYFKLPPSQTSIPV